MLTECLRSDQVLPCGDPAFDLHQLITGADLFSSLQVLLLQNLVQLAYGNLRNADVGLRRRSSSPDRIKTQTGNEART